MSGIIYKATNKINGDIYIGKTLTSLPRRIAQHKCCSLKLGSNIYFHNAIRKYGIKNFEWEEIVKIDSAKKLRIIEKFYIATYRKMYKLYNLTDGGDGVEGYKHTKQTIKKIKLNRPNLKGIPRSLETKNKISQSHIGKKFSKQHIENLKKSHLGKKLSIEQKEKLSGRTPWNKGVKLSDEHKRKLSESHKGQIGHWTGKNFSDEHKRKLSESHKNKKLSTEQRKKISKSLKKHYSSGRKIGTYGKNVNGELYFR